ncbi:ABC transporter substrate-binding protein [Cohnella thailandensis]|uniref:ABC transporter substrate-binding protein n=1 Tax=Cohnella thailandensis TaxID=557557 RepID=A0A841T6Z8_9BACL|nr:ABC transporter substrate-binding protein [Cohnella thailandensis]MBB6637627.1 ABC transporter substrate-binding protein [Cohnella thailandensis]MBP1974197.1 ABC-type glycerol-3-phosphate transport system substrate-binding protein [Cohnella thailandensis]
MQRQWNRIRPVAFFAAVMLLILPSAGCFSGSSRTETAGGGGSAVNLIYYTIGDPDPDLQMVNDKINEVLVKKIGVTVSYIKVGWQEYEDRLNTLVSAGTPFDIAFAPEYATYAQRGAWLKLNDYLGNAGKDMYDAIDPIFWQGVRMEDGGIYGVPTNKEAAVRDQWMYPEALVKKYKIDISKYTTLASLEPLLRMIQEKEPAYQPMELDKDSQNFFALDGYAYVSEKTLPLMVRVLDPSSPVVNIFETAEARKVLDILRRYYTEGYINEDAALRENQGLKRGELVFWKAAGGGPLSENSWSKDRGYKLVASPVTPAIITTESVRGGVMAISADTKHPLEAVKFLNLLNTDPEVRNLFNFGIEGVHYNLDNNGQVVPIPRKDNNGNPIPDALPSYGGVQYTQGNWFILKTMGGEFPDPLDKWDRFRESNREAVNSSTLGFTPDLSRMPLQMQNIEMVWEKYFPSLMTGSVDVDTVLPLFNEELRQAGIDEVRSEVQRQLDSWRAAHS